MLRYAPELPGHVAGLVGAGNTVANTYTYTPFGEPLTTSEQVPQPLRYMAREYDAETGLYYVRARYYDPQQGRFVSEDPIGLAGGINPYAYVGNDPANFRDPFGLCRWYHVWTGESYLGVAWVGCAGDAVFRSARGSNYSSAFSGGGRGGQGRLEQNDGGPGNSERIILGAAAILAPVKPYLDAAAFAITMLPLTAEGTGAMTVLGLRSAFVPELAPAIVNTFRSGAYSGYHLQEPMSMYRVIGGSGNPTGAYWTASRPNGPFQAVIDLALDQNWGNPATHLVTARMPAGTLVYQGFASAQRGLVGGGSQFFVPNVNAAWVSGVLPF